VLRNTSETGAQSPRSQLMKRWERQWTVQSANEADNRRDRRTKAGKGNHASRVQPIALGTRSASESVRERFAKAIFAGDRSELDQILREIAKIFSPSDSPEEFLRLMASLLIRAARCAVKQHIVREKLRDLALTDDLTGLHNRRGFFALAGQQIKISRRNHRWALLFFADLDGLKQINDRFGHSEGDRAIVRVAQILRDTFRKSDIIARLGGDEFAILANEASADSQEAIWGRLKENLGAEASRDPRYSLSLSIGVARFDPQSAVALGELLEYADQAMYEAKRASEASSFPGSPGRPLMPTINPGQGYSANATSTTNSKISSMVPLNPKPAKRAKVTLLFAHLPQRRGSVVGFKDQEVLGDRSHSMMPPSHSRGDRNLRLHAACDSRNQGRYGVGARGSRRNLRTDSSRSKILFVATPSSAAEPVP
jgi:diguanylate cyclase (GGDEF)-like protein